MAPKTKKTYRSKKAAEQKVKEQQKAAKSEGKQQTAKPEGKQQKYKAANAKGKKQTSNDFRKEVTDKNRKEYEMTINPPLDTKKKPSINSRMKNLFNLNKKDNTKIHPYDKATYNRLLGEEDRKGRPNNFI
jgi:hypothetical protein